jgi:hypothetical protein
MTFLRSLITRFGGFDQLAAGTESQFTSGSEGGYFRFDAMWDEALLACIHCETACAFLDRMGARWK